jgi:hypothetical protein
MTGHVVVFNGKIRPEPHPHLYFGIRVARVERGPIAKRIAASIGIQHHAVALTEGRFLAKLEAALDSLDQPSFDGLNAY